ncbi:hypothetical protein ACOQFO_16760 [Ureibacillus sp. MALMAid1270]|uniref:hypothetical protein n=1 Tax=Ureibacillus sp. MALMAid1270 TaxID=3411629 RepID=UPI003BA48B08
MKKSLLYLSVIAAMTLAACTNENTATEQEQKSEEGLDQTPQKELVYTLNGEEVIETDVDFVKINNTNIKMILPSDYSYRDGNSANQSGDVASYSVSVTGKEEYEGTRFYFENALKEDSEEMIEMNMRSNVTMTGLEANHELHKVDSTKFDVLYKMTAPGHIIYFAAKTFEGKTHYISAYIFDSEKLGYEDYVLKALDSIEFVSED